MAGALLAALALVAVAVPPPKLSEIRADSLPPLTNVEYVEITGVAGDPLDGLAIVVIGDADEALGPALGDSGVVEAVVRLDGHAIPADRSFLVHASGLLWVLPDLAQPVGLEDADNLTVLLVRNCKAETGDDLDLDDDGALDASPWSEVVDGVSLVWGAPGVASEWTYAPAQAGPAGGMFIFHARRCLDTDAWVLGPNAFTTVASDETAGIVNPPCAGMLCPGDLDTDGVVNSVDLAILLAKWGQLGTVADIDGSGVVGAGDLAALLAKWGACDL